MKETSVPEKLILTCSFFYCGTFCAENPRWPRGKMFYCLQVVFLDVLEVAISAHFKLIGCGVVSHDDCVCVLLQRAYCPNLGDRAFHGSLQGACLGVTVNEDEYLASVHHCAYAYGEGVLWHLVHVVVEEA